MYLNELGIIFCNEFMSIQLKLNNADDPMYPFRHTKLEDNYGIKGIYSCWTQSKFVE